MKNSNFFKDIFESIPEYRKIVSLVFLIQIDVNCLYECGFLKIEINYLNKEFNDN